jgi:hypothetical protein
MLTIFYPYIVRTRTNWENFNHKSSKLSINIKIQKVSPPIAENLSKNEASLEENPWIIKHILCQSEAFRITY